MDTNSPVSQVTYNNIILTPVMLSCVEYCIYLNTTVNFSLAGVRLLIEGSSYLRVAFINFVVTPLGDIDMID